MASNYRTRDIFNLMLQQSAGTTPTYAMNLFIETDEAEIDSILRMKGGMTVAQAQARKPPAAHA